MGFGALLLLACLVSLSLLFTEDLNEPNETTALLPDHSIESNKK
jgi:hypothetical protein